jgi:hypothetical protein
VEWIHLPWDRNCWRTVVSAVMNVQVLAPRSYTYNALDSQDPLLQHYQKGDQHNNKSKVLCQA